MKIFVSPAKAGFDVFGDLDPRAYARGYRYAAPTALVERQILECAGRAQFIGTATELWGLVTIYEPLNPKRCRATLATALQICARSTGPNFKSPRSAGVSAKLF